MNKREIEDTPPEGRMKISKNSLVSKMIRNTFWGLGVKIDLPKTSCGYFFGGLGSGLLHITFILSIMGFTAGFVDGALLWLLKEQDTAYYPVCVNSILNTVDFTITSAIPLCFLLLGFVIGASSLVLIPFLVIIYLCERGHLTPSIDNLLGLFGRGILWVCKKSKLGILSEVIYEGVVHLLYKVRKLCKDIDYKER